MKNEEIYFIKLNLQNLINYIHTLLFCHKNIIIQSYIPIFYADDLVSLYYYYQQQILNGCEVYIATNDKLNTQDFFCCCWIHHNTLIYFCNPAYQHQGYMTQMLQTLLPRLDYEKLYCYIDHDNIISQKTIAKINGFIYSGNRCLNNKIIHHYIYTK